MCVCGLLACIYAHVGDSPEFHPKDFCRDCTELDSEEISGQAQCLPYNGRPPLWWWRCLIVFQELSRASVLTVRHQLSLSCESLIITVFFHQEYMHHKTNLYDTAQPCHFLKPNWKPSSSHSASILTNISTQFLLVSVGVWGCVCSACFLLFYYSLYTLCKLFW